MLQGGRYIQQSEGNIPQLGGSNLSDVRHLIWPRAYSFIVDGML
jgi:hypothetical protein